jgi:hypothetical protein
MAGVEIGVRLDPALPRDDRRPLLAQSPSAPASKIKKVPSDYFRDHWLATFIVDPERLAVRHLVGVDNMSWSTDFPHHGNDWPYSRKLIDALFAEFPATSGARSCARNAARVLGADEL